MRGGLASGVARGFWIGFAMAGCGGSSTTEFDAGLAKDTGVEDVAPAVDVPAVVDRPVRVDVPPPPRDVPVQVDVRPPADVPARVDVPPPMDVPARVDVPPPPRDVPPAMDVPVTGSSVAVAAFHFDAQRSGANRGEGRLTVAAVRGGGFGRDPGFAPALDGDVYAQPLYLPGVAVAGGARDLLFVATQANSVYALDATSGATVWRAALGTPVPRSSQPCGNINPTTGVLGTPVLDPVARTLYAVAFTTPDGGRTKVFQLHALDVGSGMARAGYPVPIRPPAVGSSSFDPNPTGERGALALVGGRVYVPFGGLFGDCGTYHGWLVGIDTATPTRQAAFATPGRGSGIWAVGGASADAAGRLFVATGNGFGAGSMGEYVVRLGAGPVYGGATADFFVPSDARTLDLADVDIGSIGPLVLEHPGSPTPRLLFQAGKAGVGYLLDRDDLGGIGRGDGTTGEGLFSARLFSGGIFGAAAMWSDGNDVYVFVPGRGSRSCPAGGSNGVLALRLRTMGAGSAFSVAWCTASITEAVSPTVSSNGNADGIVWVAGASSPSLRAYSIADGTELFASSGANAPPSVRRWTPPVVADGRVYVTGTRTVSMFRLR